MKWYLGQLIPQTYCTTYRKDGKHYFYKWKMWLGHRYEIENIEIVG